MDNIQQIDNRWVLRGKNKSSLADNKYTQFSQVALFLVLILDCIVPAWLEYGATLAVTFMTLER